MAVGYCLKLSAIGLQTSLKVVDNDSEIRSALALSSAAEDSIVLVEEWV